MINFWSESKSISFAGCVTQLFLFALFIVTEGFLLAAMAYDRFIAICNPLPLLSVQMSTRFCVQLVAGSYFLWLHQLSSSDQHVYFILFVHLGPLTIFTVMTVHFKGCLVLPSSSINWFLSVYLASLFCLPSLVIIVSYLYIVSTVVKMPSTEGRQAFSTCSSHLGVVSVLYGAGSFMCLTPDTYPKGSIKMASLCYTLLTPIFEILWFTLWETKMSKKLWGRSWGKIYFYLFHLTVIYLRTRLYNNLGSTDSKMHPLIL